MKANEMGMPPEIRLVRVLEVTYVPPAVVIPVMNGEQTWIAPLSEEARWTLATTGRLVLPFLVTTDGHRCGEFGCTGAHEQAWFGVDLVPMEKEIDNV